MSVISEYQEQIFQNLAVNELQSIPSGHYTGNFGFNSLLISVTGSATASNEALRASIEAHEAFHAIQAFTQQAAREFFRATQTISRFRFLFLGTLIEQGHRVTIGTSIFDAAEQHLGPSYEAARHQLEDAFGTVNRCGLIRDGTNILHLIEGAATAVQCLNSGESIALLLRNAPELYTAAWRLYTSEGGKEPAVFAQLCSAALRYGTIDPIFEDTYPHPSEVFSYLSSFALYFEGILNEQHLPEPDFSQITPPGSYDEFGPIRAGKPLEFLEDIPESKTRNHFYPDEMFEEPIESALETYNSSDQSQRQLEDRLFGISMAIAKAMDVGYIRVADPLAAAKSSERKLTLDLVQRRLAERLPGLYIEEVFIHALSNREFQAHIAKVFKDEIASLGVQAWSNDHREVPVEVLTQMYDLADRVERLSLAEGALRQGDIKRWGFYTPRCCSIHRGLKPMEEICQCENEGSINRDFGEMFGIDLEHYLNG
jgi:hypothetical protein